MIHAETRHPIVADRVIGFLLIVCSVGLAGLAIVVTWLNQVPEGANSFYRDPNEIARETAFLAACVLYAAAGGVIFSGRRRGFLMSCVAALLSSIAEPTSMPLALAIQIYAILRVMGKVGPRPV